LHQLPLYVFSLKTMSSWEMQVSSGAWMDAPFKPPVKIEEGKKATFTFQNIPCTIEFKSTTEGVVTAKDKTYNARPKNLEALDSHEAERKVSQKRVSAQFNAEQMKVISDMEHAEHEAKEERKSNRKSAVEAMEEERKSLVAEHGDAMRKVSSVPNREVLQEMMPRESQHHEGEKHPDTVKKAEMERNSLTPLDAHEEDRKVSQRKASRQSEAEQMRVIAEQEHAEHDAKVERKSNRKSAVEAMEEERKSLVTDHGDAIRKVPSVPCADQLKDLVPKDWQDSHHTGN